MEEYEDVALTSLTIKNKFGSVGSPTSGSQLSVHLNLGSSLTAGSFNAEAGGSGREEME